MCQEDSLEKVMDTRAGVLAWENPMDRGTWPATIHEVAKSQTRISYQTTVTVLSLHVVLNCLFACLSLAELDLC